MTVDFFFHLSHFFSVLNIRANHNNPMDQYFFLSNFSCKDDSISEIIFGFMDPFKLHWLQSRKIIFDLES